MSTLPQTVRIERLTWPLIRAFQEDCALLVLPLGATEQHGPALPINTDTVIADALCAAACEQAGVAMAPVMPYTSSAAHSTKWPGTFSLTPKTFMDALVQYANVGPPQQAGPSSISSMRMQATTQRCASPLIKIRLELMGQLQVGYLNTFFIDEVIEAHFTEDATDLHANKGECDLMLHLAPETVDQSAMSSADDPDRTEGLVFSYPVSQTSLNGCTGAPSRGNADDGARLFAMMVKVLVAQLEAAKTERAPLPQSEWAGAPKGFYE